MTAADCGLRGLALLDAVIEHIGGHPETWNQDDYRCGSGLCVAGLAAEMAGGRWAADPDDVAAAWLLAEGDDPPGDVLPVGPHRRVVAARSRAIRLLEISSGTASNLFYGANSLDTIRRIRDEIAAGAR